MYKLVLYYNDKFKDKAKALADKGRLVFDEVIEYSEKDFKESEFCKAHKHISGEERGAGYWIWKPYILLDVISRSNNVDKILYLDCGDDFDSDIKWAIDSCLVESDLCLTRGSFKASKYTKRDCFVLMGCDEEKYWNSIQIEAGVIVFKPTDSTRSVFNEWMTYCCDENILTDLENSCGKSNFSEFVDHRHDQSVLNNLAVKLEIKVSPQIRRSVICNKND